MSTMVVPGRAVSMISVMVAFTMALVGRHMKMMSQVLYSVLASSRTLPPRAANRSRKAGTGS